MVATRDRISFRFQGRQAIGDGNATAAAHQEGKVILGVANPDSTLRRQVKLFQRCHRSGSLVDAGWQHHDGALVEKDLQLQ
jgi:hypothetical protein